MGQYQDALDYIFGYVNYERQSRYRYDAQTFDLSRMVVLLDKLGRPQEQFQAVHIAGTKGKGSTSAMVESVLRAAGFRTALYTSPHLHTFRERIRADNRLISKRELVDVLNAARPAIEDTPGITAFEIMTALAFVYFARQEVEWAVLEVGLGGRLDATNVVRPEVCGITSLSFDHMDLLGHTLSLIAWEKAGIAKAGVPLVSAPQEPEAMDVIRQVCGDIGARLVTVGEDWIVEVVSEDITGQTLTVRRTHDGLEIPGLRIPLLGQHQCDNTGVAVAMLAELNVQGVEITEAALREGLADVQWPGRFEVLSRAPVLVVDSAHNTDSARKLRSALVEWFPAPPRGRTALVFGASADKDIAGMLEAFLGAENDVLPIEKILITRSVHPRAAATDALLEQVRSYLPSAAVSVHDSPDAALEEVLAWAEPDDLICVTGSIFVVAQVRRAWALRRPETFATDDWVFQDETNVAIVPDDAPELATIGLFDAPV
jgi:dihydrofolate synthase/folylpolyglutamate synthase